MINFNCPRLRLALWAAMILFSVNIPAAEAAASMRPALVGGGSRALINLIDAKGLVKRGQTDGIVLFACGVQPSGGVSWFRVYRASKGSELLKQEVKVRLHNASFIPAMYNGHNTYATFYGTVMLHVNDGKPRLRIFANQYPPELEKESDFIGPQPFYLPNHFYHFPDYPEGSWWSEQRPAVVDLSLTVDATGKLLDVHVIKPGAAGAKFEEVAIKQMKELTWLPPYRNGQPTTTTMEWPFVFVPIGWRWR